MSRDPFPKSRRLIAEAVDPATVEASRPLTQALLDREGCDTPGCDCDDSQLYLSPTCHPRAGIGAIYDKPTGALLLNCRICQRRVATVAVAAS